MYAQCVLSNHSSLKHPASHLSSKEVCVKKPHKKNKKKLPQTPPPQDTQTSTTTKQSSYMVQENNSNKCYNHQLLHTEEQSKTADENNQNGHSQFPRIHTLQVILLWCASKMNYDDAYQKKLQTGHCDAPELQFLLSLHLQQLHFKHQRSTSCTHNRQRWYTTNRSSIYYYKLIQHCVFQCRGLRGFQC